MVCKRWCVTKGRCMSPSGTPATQNEGGCQMMSPSTMPAKRSEGGCHQVPRLPRETKVNVTKCHACHAKRRGAPGDKSGPSAPHSTMSATPATQNDGGCEFVPRLPRETKVDVTKCHACHAKRRGAPGDKSGPSAPHSTMSATPATQKCMKGGVWQRGVWKMVCDKGCVKDGVWQSWCVTKLCVKDGVWQSRCVKDGVWRIVCDGVWEMVCDKEVCERWCVTKMVCKRWCVTKGRCMSPSGTPATQNEGGCQMMSPSTMPASEAKVDVTKCHACHVKRRWMSPSATPATQRGAAPQATNPDQACHTVPWVPRLPRETKVDVTKCHACHAKRRWMWVCATPATWNEGGCHQATQRGAAPQATNPDQARHTVPWVPRLPRKTTVDVTKCHACHVNRRWMSPSATPATQRGAAPQATNPDQARHTVPWVPRLPRKTTVDVTKCHACHVKRRWMSPSATPATQRGAAPQATNPDQARHTVPWVLRLPRKTTVDVTGKFVYVKLLYVKFVCVKLLYVTFVYVKLLYVKFVYVGLCVLSYCRLICVWEVCVCWFVYVKLL